jgi:sporulation protein YlmC with PRC-barrel domain
MAFPKLVAQRHAGLVTLVFAAVAVAALLFAAGAGAEQAAQVGQRSQVSKAPQGSTGTVTDIRIDDEGIKVDDQRLEPGEGVVREGQSASDHGEDWQVRVSDKDVVRFGDDIIIDEDEVVQGDAVAILGSVIVNGVVEGDAVAVGGGLTIGPKGRVDGDGVSIGGGVYKDPGAVIRGQTVSVGKGGKWVNGQHVSRGLFHQAGFPFGLFTRVGRLFLFIVCTLLIILLGLVVAAVARRPVENVCMTVKKEAFKMGLIGLAAEVLVVPVIVLFCITIIGIPIGLVAIPMVLALAMLLGYTGVGLAVGERFAGAGNGKSIYWSLAVGMLVLEALKIVSGLVRLPGGVLGMIGWVIAFIGWAVIYVAVTVGLGAVIMTRFGTRPAAPPMPVPPVPPAAASAP